MSKLLSWLSCADLLIAQLQMSTWDLNLFKLGYEGSHSLEEREGRWRDSE